MTSSDFYPKRVNNILDTCAFVPKVEPEASCAERFLGLLIRWSRFESRTAHQSIQGLSFG